MASRGRSRGLIFIIIAAAIFILAIIVTVIALGSSLLFGGQANNAPVLTPTPSGVMVDIIIVQQPVSRGTVMTEGVLAKIPYPQSAMVEGLFFTDIKDVVGKRAKYDLQQGTPLVPNLLSDKTVGSLSSMQIPKGMVAVSIPIDTLTSVSYAVQAGDHVNVISAFYLVDLDANFQSELPNKIGLVAPPQTIVSGGQSQASSINSITAKIDPAVQGRAELDATLNQPIYVQPSESQRARLINQTVIQNAVVLGVGDLSGGPSDSKPAAGPTAAAGTQATPTAVPPKAKIITLIVSPQDAETLNYLVLAEAHLTLALRNSQDDQNPATDAVTLQYLMDQYNIPYPAKLPYGLKLPSNAATPVPAQ